MELKQRKGAFDSAKTIGLNRTTMELKRDCLSCCLYCRSCLNRTTMELKRHIQYRNRLCIA